MAGLHEFGQHELDARQGGQRCPHLFKLVLGQPASLFAVGTIVQPQQFADLIQAEAQALGRFHEPQPRHVQLSVAADAARGALRFQQQSLALIETEVSPLTPAALAKAPMVRLSRLLRLALDSVHDHGLNLKTSNEYLMPSPAMARCSRLILVIAAYIGGGRPSLEHLVAWHGMAQGPPDITSGIRPCAGPSPHAEGDADVIGSLDTS